MRNKKHLSLFFLLALFAFLAMEVRAQNISTMGKDFWVSFLPNWPGSTPKLELLVASQHSCSGKVENPLTGWSTTFSVVPGEVTTILIPNSEGLMGDNNKIEHKAIHVTATEDVSLYASNFVTATYDVANVLPTEILRSNYVVQSYELGFGAGQGELYSKLLIVGTENGTEVEIDPKGGLWGYFPPSSKRTITLNRGECFLLISLQGDISGTTVMAKDDKKIAVFSGGDTQIPSGGCCFDAVFEQSVPMEYLGRHFVVTATAMRDNDMVRITSITSGCRIYVDGKLKRTLGKNKSYDFKLDSKKKEAVYISTSAPVVTCVYFTSATMGGDMGDPSMVNINPVEQQMDKVTFCTYNTVVSNHHFVNIVTLTKQVGGITLDGQSIASEFQPVPSKKELSYARVSVNHGSHTLEAATGGFVAHVYGLGAYESYAYTVGSNSKVLNQFDDEGNLIFSETPSEIDSLDVESPAEVDEPEPEPEPTYVSVDTLPDVRCDSITMVRFKEGAEIRGAIEDPDNVLGDHDIIEIIANPEYPYLLDPIEVVKEGDSLVFGVRARNQWCDCFVPEELDIEILIIYEDGEDGEQQSKAVSHTSIYIDRGNSWFKRCFWVLVTIGVLLLFILYLRALLKKNRFKKSARIKYSIMEMKGSVVRESAMKNGPRLREKGFIPWFRRWLVPFRDERRSITWAVPPAGSMTYVAAESKNKVYFTKESFNSRKMRMGTYNPQASGSRLVEMDTIQVYQDQKYQGRLEYEGGSKNDERVFRIVVVLLMLLSAIAISVLTILMLRGIL